MPARVPDRASPIKPAQRLSADGPGTDGATRPISIPVSAGERRFADICVLQGISTPKD